MKNKVTVSAPGKLMLFGEHSVVYGNPCIVTAVDQRIEVDVEKVPGDEIEIAAKDVGIDDFKIKITDIAGSEFPKQLKFVLTAVRNFFAEYKVSTGLRITTRSGFSSLFGFGSSSAVTVCTVKALSAIFDVEVTNKSLFDICYKTVLDIQGVGSGFDIAAAVWGGTLYFVGGGKEILPLKIDRIPLVVGYTGVKADTATLVKKVAGLAKEDKQRFEKIFNSITEIVEEGKIALENTNYLKLGELMDENQKYLEDLGVSSRELDLLIGASKSAGAFGAKLSGAGGGDCMIAVAPKDLESEVKKAIEKAGGTVLDVKTNAEGVTII